MDDGHAQANSRSLALFRTQLRNSRGIRLTYSVAVLKVAGSPTLRWRHAFPTRYCIPRYSPRAEQGSKYSSPFYTFHLLPANQAVAPRKANQTVASSLRAIIEKGRESGNLAVFQDVQNALLFLRSQREHKVSPVCQDYHLYGLIAALALTWEVQPLDWPDRWGENPRNRAQGWPRHAYHSQARVQPIERFPWNRMFSVEQSPWPRSMPYYSSHVQSDKIRLPLALSALSTYLLITTPYQGDCAF